jgi:hypothetical protein
VRRSFTSVSVVGSPPRAEEDELELLGPVANLSFSGCFSPSAYEVARGKLEEAQVPAFPNAKHHAGRVDGEVPTAEMTFAGERLSKPGSVNLHAREVEYA